MKYINQGITLGSVNLPEVQLRSLTLDEPDHARVCQDQNDFKQRAVVTDREYRSSTSTATCLAFFARVMINPVRDLDINV